MLPIDPQLTHEDSEKLNALRKATRNCLSILKTKTDPV